MRTFIPTVLLFLSLSLQGCGPSYEERNKTIITSLYQELEDKGYNVGIVDKYFDKSYIQLENYKTYNFEAFKDHVRDVQSMTRKVKFLPFEQIITKDNYVIVRYFVKAQIKDRSLQAPMVAIYELNKDGKIIRLCEAGVTSDMVKNSDYVLNQATTR